MAGGEVEFVEFERGVARGGAEEEGVFAVGGELRCDGAAEGVVAGLGEVAEVGEVGVRGGGGRGGWRRGGGGEGGASRGEKEQG